MFEELFSQGLQSLEIGPRLFFSEEIGDQSNHLSYSIFSLPFVIVDLFTLDLFLLRSFKGVDVGSEYFLRVSHQHGEVPLSEKVLPGLSEVCCEVTKNERCSDEDCLVILILQESLEQISDELSVKRIHQKECIFPRNLRQDSDDVEDQLLMIDEA